MRSLEPLFAKPLHRCDNFENQKVADRSAGRSVLRINLQTKGKSDFRLAFSRWFLATLAGSFGNFFSQQAVVAVSIDYASMEVASEQAKSSFVVTTWHENDTPEELAHFFLNCTSIYDNEFTNFLILSVGKNDDLLAAIARHCQDT